MGPWRDVEQPKKKRKKIAHTGASERACTGACRLDSPGCRVCGAEPARPRPRAVGWVGEAGKSVCPHSSPSSLQPASPAQPRPRSRQPTQPGGCSPPLKVLAQIAAAPLLFSFTTAGVGAFHLHTPRVAAHSEIFTAPCSTHSAPDPLYLPLSLYCPNPSALLARLPVRTSRATSAHARLRSMVRRRSACCARCAGLPVKFPDRKSVV